MLLKNHCLRQIQRGHQVLQALVIHLEEEIEVSPKSSSKINKPFEEIVLWVLPNPTEVEYQVQHRFSNKSCRLDKEFLPLKLKLKNQYWYKGMSKSQLKQTLSQFLNHSSFCLFSESLHLQQKFNKLLRPRFMR